MAMGVPFPERIEQIRTDLVEQGRRVQSLVELAFEALFDRSTEKARRLEVEDDAVDAADVQLERGAVALLFDATREGSHLEEHDLRRVLVAVKVNNELERIADAAVDVAALVPGFAGHLPNFPPTFRVMANSIIGIVRDANMAVFQKDPQLAKVVLQSQHTVTAFKDALLRDAELQISRGAMPLEFAFLLHEVSSICEMIADHCTNVAEQVIYATTGAIVRHTPAQWVEIPQRPTR